MSQTTKKQQNKENSSILCHGCIPRRIILIITTGRMMILEALLEVQLGLLHTLVNGVHLFVA